MLCNFQHPPGSGRLRSFIASLRTADRHDQQTTLTSGYSRNLMVLTDILGYPVSVATYQTSARESAPPNLGRLLLIGRAGLGRG